MTTQASKVTVEVSCSFCAPIYGSTCLDARAVHLTIRRGGTNSYEFVCPRCLMDVVKEAGDIITNMMMYGRVPYTIVEVPPEAADPARSGPALSYDDLVDFMIELNREEWTLPEEDDLETRVDHAGCVPFIKKVRA